MVQRDIADPMNLVGSRVLKDFLDEFTGEMRPFGGTVRSYSPEDNWYFIIYDDGDKEELEGYEAQLLVERATAVSRAGVRGSAAKKPTAAKGVTKPSTKRKVATTNGVKPEGGSKNTTNNARKINNTASNKIRNNNNNKRLKPLARSMYTSSMPSEEEDEEEEPDNHIMDDVHTDDYNSATSGDDNSSSSESESDDNDDDESDLLLPHNPRSPGSKSGGFNGKSKSTESRENLDRNASGSGAAGARTPVASRHQPRKAKKSTPSGVKSPSSAVLNSLPPEVELNTRYIYPRGQEPWHKVKSALTVPVYETPDLSPAAVKIIHDCKQQYYRQYRKAEADETARVEAAGFFVDGKRLARRPDRVTESWMKNEGKAVHQSKIIGYVAGIRVNQRFYARSELSCVGMHGPPVAGINYIGKHQTGLGIPIAVSIVCAGWYEDDNDAGDELIFTGEGGNDLLGSRKQVEAQKLERGNAALVGNIRLGLPVRVTRKNKDNHGIYGCVLIFDGLYDVVEYWLEPGKEGHNIYRFRLVRRPGQGELLSQAVKFGGISAPKKLTPLARPGIVDLDIASGQENVPIPAVNETNDNQVPPCTALERIPEESVLKGVHRGITNQALAVLTRQKWKPTVEYVAEYKYTAGIVPPSAPILPEQFKDDPHAYIAQLNHGRLPYLESRNGKLVQLREALPVVYECGPWAKCSLGKNCPQATSQQGLRYRLEIFKTNDGRGWGVRSLDMIPQFAFVCNYYGDIYKADAFDRFCEERGHDGAYSMDMAVRPDRDWEGNTTEDRRTADNTEYVVCGLYNRNIAAFFNHSCAPNCFVQPVLGEHHDVKMPKISIFASEDIAPFTQLTWDYGEDYASFKFDDGCKCGAEDCIAVRSGAAAIGGGGSGAGGAFGSASGRTPTGSLKKKKKQQQQQQQQR